jgi:(2Fe-2S) ferredoxin
MNSLQELQKIKDEVLKDIDVRKEESKNIKIVVGMGTCGIAAGAREVLDAVIDEINKRDLKNIEVTHTGCNGLCAQEPLMEIFMPDGNRTMYGNLDGKKARQIIAQHIVNHIPVFELMIKDQ